MDIPSGADAEKIVKQFGDLYNVVRVLFDANTLPTWEHLGEHHQELFVQLLMVSDALNPMMGLMSGLAHHVAECDSLNRIN